MFENKKVKVSGIHYSRYIASWWRMGNSNYDLHGQFGDWLASVGCTEQEMAEIHELTTCGKMELEHNIMKFLAKKSA